MAVKLGDLLGKLFKKIGVEITDELKPLTEIATEVPDDAAAKLDKDLLTIAAAKSNSVIRNAIKAETLTGADAKIDEIITALGLQPDESFAANKNTFEKIELLSKLALEAGKKSSGAGNKQNADDFAKKEKEYNDQIKALKETLTTKETEFKTTRENDSLEFELKSILGGKNYIFPAEMDTNLKLTTAYGAVNTELKKKGFTIKRNETGQITIVNKDGQPAYSDTNEALEPNTFIDGALAQNKLLKINDASQQQQSAASAGAFIPGQQNAGSASIVAELEAQLKTM